MSHGLMAVMTAPVSLSILSAVVVASIFDLCNRIADGDRLRQCATYAEHRRAHIEMSRKASRLLLRLLMVN